MTSTVRDPKTGATVTGTAVLTVDPGELTSLRLSPASARVLAGAEQRYAVLGFDAYGNRRGDVTTRTTFTIDPAGTCGTASCSATSAGENPWPRLSRRGSASASRTSRLASWRPAGGADGA